MIVFIAHTLQATCNNVLGSAADTKKEMPKHLITIELTTQDMVKTKSHIFYHLLCFTQINSVLPKNKNRGIEYTELQY